MRVDAISPALAETLFLECWDSVSDDGANRNEWKAPTGPSALYLGGFDDSECLVGVFAFYRMSCATLDSHVAMRPRGYGQTALDLGHMAIEWVWRNTDFNRIIAQTPEYNKLTLRYLKRLGFVRFGVNASSWLKNGKYHDMYLSGVTRGDVCL